MYIGSEAAKYKSRPLPTDPGKKLIRIKLPAFFHYFNSPKKTVYLNSILTGYIIIYMKHNAGSGALYGIGMIGALIYYLEHATTFLMGLIGIVKAIFWPAVVVYKVLEMLNL